MVSHLIPLAKILIVDDEIANVLLLKKMLAREGYRDVSTTTDSRQVIVLCDADEPDLILLDLHMPHQTGYDVLKTLAQRNPGSEMTPVIVLTADITVEAKRRALDCGAIDLICKPFDHTEVTLRIKNTLCNRFLQQECSSRRQLLEEAVQERTAQLQKTVAELRKAQEQVVQQERLRALGMMATGIAHDFNNMLSLILGYGELLLKDPAALTEKTAKYLRNIVGAAQAGTKMVNRLSQFQRPRSETELRKTISSAQLVDQAVELTMPKWKDQAMSKSIDIEVISELEEVPDIAGDPAEIRDLLTNMIFNSVDAMPDGGTITLRTRQEEEEIILEIEDTGTGMTEDIRQRCLEPFFTTKGEKGSGLGLALTYGVVQRHGGTLDVQTALGVGTKIQIRLPFREPVPLDDAPPATGLTKPIRILVVDDQPVLREILSEYLKVDGHQVTTAPDGKEALEKFREQRFDLVITDKAMPGMTGDEIAVEMRTLRPEMPILLLSGFAETGISESISDAVTAVVGKPVNLNTLRQAITAAMRQTRKQSKTAPQASTPGGGVLKRKAETAPRNSASVPHSV